MRKKIIVGNWKMNMSLDTAQDLVFKIKSFLTDNIKTEVGVCPPSLYLQAISTLTKGSKVLLGAQNMYFEEEGAFTGELSPKMLKDFPIDMVIIGHSERRQIFNETDEDVNKKVKAALKHGLTPVLCCGETLETREKGKAEEWVKNQIVKALEELSNTDIEKLIVAYEPIWAIGTGKICSGEDANKIIKSIRNVLKEKSTENISQKVRILYGGSIKSSNFSEHINYEDIDGGLVGGSSLKADEFNKLIELANNAQKKSVEV